MIFFNALHCESPSGHHGWFGGLVPGTVVECVAELLLKQNAAVVLAVFQ